MNDVLVHVYTVVVHVHVVEWIHAWNEFHVRLRHDVLNQDKIPLPMDVQVVVDLDEFVVFAPFVSVDIVVQVDVVVVQDHDDI
jgi:hypothetical protein